MIDPRELPERPPSEVEWEELLVKLEIAPRALRVASSDVPDGAALQDVLGEVVGVEAVWEWRLQRMRDGQPLSLAPDFAFTLYEDRPLLDHFAEMRARNFAWFQRRGVKVWDWRSPVEEGGSLTSYQALQAMVRHDAEALARVRGASGKG